MTGRSYGWYVVALLAACNFLNYAHRNVLFSAYDDLRGQFHASNASLGLLGSVYMGAHALATLPAGWLGDRLDRRHMLAGAAVLWSVGALAAGLAGDLYTLAASRALTGLATAAVVPVANAIIAEVFPADRKASVLAVFNVGLFLGGTIGYGIGAWAGHPAGVLGLAVPGLIAALLLVRLDVPGRGGAPVSPGLAEIVREGRSILGVRSLRWLMTSTTLMAFAAGGYQAWLLDFLKDGKGLTEREATGILGLAFVGGLAGVLTGGRVADRLRQRRAHGRPLAITIGMASTVPCAAVCIVVTDLWLLGAGAVATMFFISWYHGPMAASVDDLARPGQAVATQAVVIFTTHLLGTTPSSWVIGEIKDATSAHVAMVVPTVVVGLAAVAMSRTFSTIGADIERVRGVRLGSPQAL
jgi:MFS transporter, Spinster family, sphingosine-1-phosphate transporter